MYLRVNLMHAFASTVTSTHDIKIKKCKYLLILISIEEASLNWRPDYRYNIKLYEMLVVHRVLPVVIRQHKMRDKNNININKGAEPVGIKVCTVVAKNGLLLFSPNKTALSLFSAANFSSAMR